MRSCFSSPASLAPLCGPIALGTTTAEAAGIGVHLRVHAQNIPRAVAGGHSPHVGVGAGAGAIATESEHASIQPGGAGETTATKSPK
jgi:hypothetical protein